MATIVVQRGIRERERSNFRMAESKISIRSMLAYNKIALPRGAADAIL
jgi:hypothetical protein